MQRSYTTLGKKHSEVGATLGNIGIVHDKFANMEKALQCHEEALAIKKALGEKHSEVGVTLDNIEAVHRKRVNLETALQCHEEALAIGRPPSAISTVQLA